MAAAFFNQLADSSHAHAASAGTAPVERVHSVVVEAMREVGVDVSHNRPQRLTEELAGNALLLITMGCSDECPYLPGVEREDWPLPDPTDRSLIEVRAIRNEIRKRVRTLVDSRGWGKTEARQEG